MKKPKRNTKNGNAKTEHDTFKNVFLAPILLAFAAVISVVVCVSVLLKAQHTPTVETQSPAPYTETGTTILRDLYIPPTIKVTKHTEIFRYTTEDGVISFTGDEKMVPTRYKDRVEKIIIDNRKDYDRLTIIEGDDNVSTGQVREITNETD